MGDVAQKVVDELEVLAEEREQMGPQAAANRPPEHFVISGNPGTGKTELANILSEAMAGIDPNRSSEVAVFNASQLAGYSYMGEATAAFQSFVNENPGKVILIDEAHTLADPDGYGRSVLRAIIPLMTQKGRGAPQFIFAGYPETAKVLGDLDPGFGSRISSTFDMPDYSTADLQQIARTKLTEPISDDGGAALDAAVTSLPVFERGKQEKFANGRGVERLMDNIRKARLLRTRKERLSGKDSSEIDWRYTASDVADGYSRLKIGTLTLPKRSSAPKKQAAAAAEAPKSPSGSLKPVPAADTSYFGAQSKGPEPKRRRKRATI